MRNRPHTRWIGKHADDAIIADQLHQIARLKHENRKLKRKLEWKANKEAAKDRLIRVLEDAVLDLDTTMRKSHHFQLISDANYEYTSQLSLRDHLKFSNH